MEYTAEEKPEDSKNGPPQKAAPTKAMRIGLMQVKGLRVETIVEIVRARDAEGAFRSLEDFLMRVPAEKDEIEALIKCGAFDEVCGMTRPAMLWQWNLLQAKRKESGAWRVARGEKQEVKGEGEFVRRGDNEGSSSSSFTSSTSFTSFISPGSSLATRHSPLVTAFASAGVLFAEMEADDTIKVALREIDAPDYTREQKLRYEREVLEVCVSGHPLDFLPRNGETWSDELPGLRGKRVTLCGWVVTYRHVGTKNYRNMMFVTLEDQRGLFEVILFPDVYDKFGGLVYETRSMRVTGVVMEGEHINGERMEKLG
jgi:DNA polymerase III alpha subunit